MAKKMKKSKPRKKAAVKKRQTWGQMVIRVSVPIKDIPSMKIWSVRGMDRREYLTELEVLNAYYDVNGQPDAMPDNAQ